MNSIRAAEALVRWTVTKAASIIVEVKDEDIFFIEISSHP
jgi:hypothetical protein